MDELSALNLQAGTSGPDFSSVNSREAAKKVAEEFESMFIAQMLAPMFESLDTDGPFGGGSAERAFRPMLIEEYAKQMSAQGGIGISDQVYTEILRLQGLEPETKT